MSGVRLNSLVPQTQSSVSLDVKKDQEKSRVHWKTYAVAGGAIAAGIAFAVRSAWFRSTPNIKEFSQAVYAYESDSIPQKFGEMAIKVRDIVFDVLIENGISNSKIITIMSNFVDAIEDMQQRVPSATPEEIILLSATESIWDPPRNVRNSNDITKQVFERSVYDYDNFIKNLTQKFDAKDLSAEASEFIAWRRGTPCLYPYCENNWAPALPNSIKPASLLEMSNIVRSKIIDVFNKNKIGSQDRVDAITEFSEAIELIKKHFPNAPEKYISLLAASEGVWETDLNESQCKEVTKQIFQLSADDDYDTIIKDLTAIFDSKDLSDEASEFVAHRREELLQYPYCDCQNIGSQDRFALLSKHFPNASQKDIVLLAASEYLWEIGLNANQCNELIKEFFRKSLANDNKIIKDLTTMFDAKDLSDEASEFVAYRRKDPCQYPYCENNWAPALPESIRLDLLRQEVNDLRSKIIDVLNKNGVGSQD